MQRTATMDQVCQRVPVDAVGKHVGEYQRKPQLVELFDTPRSHEAPSISFRSSSSVAINSGSSMCRCNR